MSKTHTQNALALSVAALVASSVAAIAGVTTFESDLTGKGVYLGYEMGHDYSGGSSYPDYSGGSTYHQSEGTSGGTSGGTSPSTTTSTTSGPTGLNCAGGSLAACQKTCVKDGITNTFCTGYCAKECPSTSTTTTSTSTTVDRCAMYSLNECEALCSCAKDKFSAANDEEKKVLWYTDLWPSGGKTYGGCIETCFARKNAPPPVPVVEEPVPAAPAATPVEPVSIQPLVEPAHTAAPVFEESFEDDWDDFESGDGDFEDFSDGFHGGPGDFGGFDGDEEFMRAMVDQYGGEFSLGEDDLSGHFDDLGGGFGGDEFGVPPWMEDIGEEILGMAGEFCSGDILDEIQMAIDDGNFEEIESLMMECGGGGGNMGGGGPPDPEMMENAVEMLKIFGDKDGPVYFALSVAKKHGVFTAGEVKEIEDILVQIGEKAEEAEEACSDLPDMDEGDFFGLKGFLAQLFYEEEGDEDDDFFGDDDEDDFGGDAMRKAFEACGDVLNGALGAGPGQDEEEMGSGLMGKLQKKMEHKMQAAVDNGKIPQVEWGKVEEQFDTVMKEFGFEGEFEDHESDEDFGDFDEGDEEEEGGEDGRFEDEEEFDEEDFEF